MNHFKKPKIAIITRTKNRPLFLKRAIESVLRQNYENYCHVIINDGGNPDEFCKIISATNNKNIIAISNSQSLGMEAASNIAIQNTDSDYIAMLDDDDTWEANFLTRTIGFLENDPAAMGVSTESNIIYESIINKNIRVVHSQKKNSHKNGISFLEMMKNNTILNHSFVYRRSVYSTIGHYDESLMVLGDWDFNLRFLLHFDIFSIDENLANYHIRINTKKFGNTITQGINSHISTKIHIKNKLLRLDLKDKKIGLGVMLNIIESHERYSTTKNLIKNLLRTMGLFQLKLLFFFLFPNRHTKELNQIYSIHSSHNHHEIQ